MYPSGKSWDEVPGKMSSGKKFFHNAISGADFAAQPYYVAIVETLSEQQLVDCNTADSACNDELMNSSFAFCRENGQCTEDSYSYTSTEGTFKASSRNVELAPGSVTGYRDVSTDNGQTLMSTVVQQPVSIDIETDQSSFQSYMLCLLTASRGVSCPVVKCLRGCRRPRALKWASRPRGSVGVTAHNCRTSPPPTPRSPLHFNQP